MKKIFLLIAVLLFTQHNLQADALDDAELNCDMGNPIACLYAIHHYQKHGKEYGRAWALKSLVHYSERGCQLKSVYVTRSAKRNATFKSCKLYKRYKRQFDNLTHRGY
jgi:hypothetical protein